ATDKPYYAISPIQQHIYILNEIAGKQTTAYNMPGIFNITGNVDIERVQYAFQSLIHRHEALRTRFETIDGSLVQVIEADTQIKIDYEEEPNADIDELLEDFVKPFNLQIAPLFRVKIVKRDDQRYILLFDIHHIISDGASIYNVIREFSQLYQGHKLEEVKLQYKNYSEWINNTDFSKQRTFWLSQFEDTLPILDLLLD
ncbi:condensation domain-containing protein, partial [Staphylococcus succinus]